MLNTRSVLAPVFWVAVVAACPGCGDAERIEHYTVRKPLPIDAPASTDAHTAATSAAPTGEPKDRTLGAIVPFGDQGWFFKLVGPKDEVSARNDEFTAFVKSVQFADDGKPHWTLPQGWKAQPGSGLRFATVTIPTEPKPLELTVISLPRTAGDAANYILVNVNRWRNQMKLPPISAEQLTADSSQLELSGATATIVNLLGTASESPMARGPFSSGAGDGK